ncbi:MAG: 1-(5-phosphoribosyl)-5-amino-4-imidazole-carboxylate carboxylase, partial [Oscillospiraceae bacterium]|nr:1-(5-phosphoribosyl)-5-amino-4-imidazole-carboxylate carboxylase [Oscillospiraceae bacterium]
MDNDIKKTLEALRNGDISVDEALLTIKKQPFEDIGFAKVDLHRAIRQGAPEVIYGAGKTPEQIVKILDVMKKNGVPTILVTRLSEEQARQVSLKHEMDYRPDARIGIIGKMPEPSGIGTIVVATGGTSDIPAFFALDANFVAVSIVGIFAFCGFLRSFADRDHIL